MNPVKAQIIRITKQTAAISTIHQELLAELKAIEKKGK